MSVAMSAGRKYRLNFRGHVPHVGIVPWGRRTTDNSYERDAERDASRDRLLQLTQSPNDPNSSDLLGSL